MRWDVVAVCVAITTAFLTISPTSVQILQRFLRYVLQAAFPSLGRCERLEWLDIVDGPLHVCPSVPAYCHGRYRDGLPVNSDTKLEEYRVPHIHGQCWAHLMSAVLNRSWNSPSRRTATVKRPAALPLFQNFLCTDIKTLNMFRVFMPPGGLDVQVLDGCTVIHLNPSYVFHQPGLTKNEAAKIADGYPPWYKETLITIGGLTLDSPIQEQADIHRGGWILGVGLSSHPGVGTPAHTSGIEERKQRLREEPERASMLDRAFGRIKYTLQKLQDIYPDDTSIEAAQTIFRERRQTSKPAAWVKSGLERDFIKSNLFDEFLPKDGYEKFRAFRGNTMSRPWARSLTVEQCTLAIEVFSSLRPVSGDEADTLRPVLRQIIQAAMFGMYVVCVSWGEFMGDIPGLEGRKRVFLRTCSAEEIM